jgi:hypothetical protein
MKIEKSCPVRAPFLLVYLYHNLHKEKPQARGSTPIGVLPSLFMGDGGLMYCDGAAKACRTTWLGNSINTQPYVIKKINNRAELALWSTHAISLVVQYKNVSYIDF